MMGTTGNAARPRPVIIDCDPGIDDAIAILMALASPELDVIGITSVGGNVGIDATTRNALALTALAGRDIPVARGADLALVAQPRRAASVHGSDGLGGVVLPVPVREQEPAPAWDFIRDAADRLEGILEIVAIGPLTNLALAFAAYPRIVPKIRAIHLMGGSMGLGNATAAAEFNIWADPHAAAAVFRSGIPVAMYGLDVTHSATMTDGDIAAWKKRARPDGNGVLAPVCRMLDHYMTVYRNFGRSTLALHDPLVIANLIDPGIVELQPYYVDVETSGEFTLGKTVVDTYNVLKRPPNAMVGVSMDTPRFLALAENLITSLDAGMSGVAEPATNP